MSQAKNVSACGNFNDSQPIDLNLIQGRPSLWQKWLSLPFGRYEYQFVADGNLVPDSGAGRQKKVIAPSRSKPKLNF